MPKYTVTVMLSAQFTYDTDDDAEIFGLEAEDENYKDPNDLDVVSDYVRDMIEDNGIQEYDEPNVDDVTLKLKP